MPSVIGCRSICKRKIGDQCRYLLVTIIQEECYREVAKVIEGCSSGRAWDIDYIFFKVLSQNLQVGNLII